MSLTGNRDVDMEIILQLEDRELPAVCAVNKYVNEICSSDAFWYRRLINRITKAKDDNLSKYKKLILVDITGERIREMQRFLGLNTLKELNDFLNQMQPNAAYLAYHGFSYFDRYIYDAYNIDTEEFPPYINREELQYYLRREAIKARYTKLASKEIPYPSVRFDLIPPYLSLQQDAYDALKIMGIRL